MIFLGETAVWEGAPLVSLQFFYLYNAYREPEQRRAQSGRGDGSVGKSELIEGFGDTHL